MGYRGCERESWQPCNKWLISMEEEILKLHCAALTCFLNCWPSWSVNFQHFLACALIFNLQLRRFSLELGPGEHAPALSLWTHNSSAARRCHLASATDMILTAALAGAVFIRAPLAEDVFLISYAAFFFFLSHIFWVQAWCLNALILCRSISNPFSSVLKWDFWRTMSFH